MKRSALTIIKYGRKPTLTTEPIPELKPSQYLVRMAYAPINPADLSFLFGSYGIKRVLPSSMGFEGSGVIQKAQDSSLIGRKVSLFIPSDSRQGTLSTHVVCNKMYTMVWPDSADLRQISCSVINPFTIVGFRNLIEKGKFKNVILSAANSQLGRMAIPYLSQNKIQVIGIVRNSNQIEQLVERGAYKIFTQQGNLEELSLMPRTVFFDPVGGDLSSKVFGLLPPSSQAVLYGLLSKKPLISLDSREFFFKNKQVRGFWLNQFLQELSTEQFQGVKQEVIGNYQYFQNDIKAEYGLEQFERAIHQALDPSKGKVLLRL